MNFDEEKKNALFPVLIKKGEKGEMTYVFFPVLNINIFPTQVLR